jgi:hypothetical protein
MRVICWNTRSNAKAWAYALESLGGDVLIFQESTSPPVEARMESIFDLIQVVESGIPYGQIN